MREELTRIAAGVSMVLGLLCLLGAPGGAAADTCPNAVYRKGAGANLPECRAWEQASPVDKGGNSPLTTYPAYAAPDGGRVIFTSSGNTAILDDSQPLNLFFASSRGSGWSTQGVDAPTDYPAVYFALVQSTYVFSVDGTKAFEISTRKLAPGGVEGASNLYVRDLAAGTYRLAASIPGRQFYNDNTNATNIVYGADPDLQHIVIPYSGGLYETGDGRLDKVNLAPDGTSLLPKQTPSSLSPQQPVVSQDGRRVTFSAEPNAGTPGLFQRVDGSSTVLISRSHRAGDDPTVGVDTNYYGPFPSADGRRVIFSTTNATNLTDDGPSALYRWDASGDRLTNLLAGASPALAPDAGNLRILRASTDGRYVWFSYDDPSSGPTVAVLDAESKRVTALVNFSGPLAGNSFDSVRFSPDGTKMVGSTRASLTGYDQTCSGDPSGRCAEAFLFDAEDATPSARCVSCGPAGTHSIDSVVLGFPSSGFPFPDPSLVTNDARVFFSTGQRLSSTDVNSASDVYEYAPGRGAALMSSGTDTAGAFVSSASASGDDVFFFTDGSLVPQDQDVETDVYDARVGGGLAAQQVTRTDASSCPTGSCPGARPAPPAAETPGSTLVRSQPKPPRFSVARVSAAARRAAAASGRLRVTATVGAAGRLTARASARLGKRTVTVGGATTAVRRAGRVTLTVALSSSARRALARGGRVTLKLAVSYSKASRASTQAVALTEKRARSSAKGGAR